MHTDPTECEPGSIFRFIKGSKSTGADELTATYAPLISELTVGDSVMLADGTVSMAVVGKTADEVRCRVVAGRDDPQPAGDQPAGGEADDGRR